MQGLGSPSRHNEEGFLIRRGARTSIATVLRQLHWAADHCQAVMDHEFQSLRLDHVQPAFLCGKRSADNARKFMKQLAGRLWFPGAYASDAHAYAKPGYRPVVQISTDGFSAYPEAVDRAFGPYAKFGTIIKEYRNSNIVCQPSEIVGSKRRAVFNIK